MATHSSVLAGRIPGTAEPRVSGAAQSRTRLKRLGSSSSSISKGILPLNSYDLKPLVISSALSWAFLVAQMVKNLPVMRVQSLGWEDPLEKGMATRFRILGTSLVAQMVITY